MAVVFAVGAVVVVVVAVVLADGQDQPVAFSAWLIQIWFWVRPCLDSSESCLIFLLGLSDLFRVILVQMFGVVVVVIFLPWCTMVLLEKLVRS